MIAQVQILNKILNTKDGSIITLNNFDAEYFSEFKEEYKFIKEHLNEFGKVPDKETFLDKFPDFQVMNVTESDEYLVEELSKDYRSRYLANTFNKVRQLVMDGKIDEASNIYKNSLEGLTKATAMKSIDITKDVSRYDRYIERTQNFAKYFVRTGFPELDEIIGGWDRYEELATIAARTNMGKSWALIKMASAALEQGLKVGLYSGEMSEMKVGYRLDTVLGHISNGALVHGNNVVQENYKKFIDELPHKYKGSLKVLTPSMISGPAGVNALRAFIERENLDILFVDQHSLLEDDRHGKSPVEKASNISRDLKNLQVSKQIPIITVSQQNRTSTLETGVGTEHIAQSDRIAQDSTIVIFFEKKDDMMKMHLVKSRDSENSKDICYQVDLNTGTWTYVPDEKDGLEGKKCSDYEHRYDVVSSGVDAF